MRKTSVIKRFFILGVSAFASCLVMLNSSLPLASAAVSAGDIDSIRNNTAWYDPTDTLSGVCSDNSGTVSTTAVVTTKQQQANAAAVIGIAKTENLGKQGALIGLMVAQDESGFKIYANSTVPPSMSYPNKQAVGSNYDSVGIMQQRPSMTWSTIATGPAAINNKDAVWQIMNPAYAAEAFFGSPPGSNAPPALSKGLQNKPGWQKMDPWLAAQAVQASGDSSGSNYKAQMGIAQSLLDKLWDSSPPVPLPVPLKGGGGTASASSDTGTGSACNGTTASVDLGQGKGSFTDDTSITYPGVDQAIARAQEIAKQGALMHQVCGGSCYHECDQVSAAVWNHSSSGYWTAMLHWQAMVSQGYGHPGSRHIPVGSLVFYSTGDPSGHAAVYLGNNKIGSSDILGDGGYYIVDASKLENGPWNLHYLGWSVPVFGDGKYYK